MTASPDKRRALICEICETVIFRYAFIQTFIPRLNEHLCCTHLYSNMVSCKTYNTLIEFILPIFVLYATCENVPAF